MEASTAQKKGYLLRFTAGTGAGAAASGLASSGASASRGWCPMARRPAHGDLSCVAGSGLIAPAPGGQASNERGQIYREPGDDVAVQGL